MSYSKLIAVMTLLINLGLASCGRASFFGGGKSKNPDNGEAQNPQVDPNNPTGVAPNGGSNPQGVPPNQPNGNYPPGTTPNGLPPGWNPNGQTIIPNPDVSQPTPNQIVFGENKFFHIGDNKFVPESNCALEINSHALVGTKYFFEFYVTTPGTVIQQAVARKVCGVDNNTSNFASIGILGIRALQSFKLNHAMNNKEFRFEVQSIPLNPGAHMIVVDSMPNLAGSGAKMENGMVIATGDRDDFLIGNILIEASQPIKPGRVGTMY